MRLFTLRSDSQFNTTIYTLDDRFRGVRGARTVLATIEADIKRHGPAADSEVSLEAVSPDQIKRQADAFRIIPFGPPPGCVAGYYPECNSMIPLSHHAKESKVPAAKAIPVRIVATQPV